jgi:hypothetical protein
VEVVALRDVDLVVEELQRGWAQRCQG